MSMLDDRLREMAVREQEKDRSRDKEMREQEEESKRQKQFFHSEVRPKLRQANPKDYRKWLEGWVAEGGEISHYFDYSLPSDFFVAIADVDIPSLYGAHSINVIVPEGITVTFGEGLGHSNLYFMSNFDHAGCWVPAYKNL